MQELMHAEKRENPTVPHLSGTASAMLERYPLLAIGSVDDSGAPWTTILGGSPGFARGLPDSNIAMKLPVDGKHDPVIEILMGGKNGSDPQAVRGKPFSALSINLEDRRRVKLYGTGLAAIVTEVAAEDGEPTHSQLQFIGHIDGSLGNCPKYLNKKHVVRHISTSSLLSQGPRLTSAAEAVISNSDIFFISSINTEDSSMDTNHRGGPPGFVRVAADKTRIVWPEYSGNQLYQSLGNLLVNPLAGVVFADHLSGDVVYVTGTTEIHVGIDAEKVIRSTNLAVSLTIKEYRHVRDGIHWRADTGEPSPYNPPVRKLAGETKDLPSAGASTQARLVSVKHMTPTIARLQFKVTLGTSATKLVQLPGQWVALDFSNRLDQGYSHMRDADPTSLNDDYVRTFTISSAPSLLSETGDTFEITMRKIGRVTSALFDHDPARYDFDVTVRGIGGEYSINTADSDKVVGFFASGVGITPLLSSIPGLDVQRLIVLWSLRYDDVPLVLDTLKQYPQLADRLCLYITGTPSQVSEKNIASLRESKVKFETRRVAQGDFEQHEIIADWYICTTPALARVLTEWLPGKNIIVEDFAF